MSRRDFLIIAHRGFSDEAPENTYAAFDRALEAGFTRFELDLQLTLDDEVVVMHDFTVDRTTGGSGAVANRTWAELAQLDAGAWFGPNFVGQPIPHLAAFLYRYRHRAQLHLELKSLDPALPARVATLLRETGWIQDALAQEPGAAAATPLLVLSSYARNQIDRSRRLLPRLIPHDLLVEEVDEDSMVWAERMGLRSYSPAVEDVTPEVVRLAHHHHLQVGAWWNNWEPDKVRGLARAGGLQGFVNSPTQATDRLSRHYLTPAELAARLSTNLKRPLALVTRLSR